ncbi:MAG: Rho termination factor N-terminal domain-containing protein, partial [Lapillicoccus sp.]
MTDTTERVDAAGSSDSSSPARATRTGRTGLATMNVAELKRLASGLGITGTTKMRKDDLLAAIGAHQSGGAARAPQGETAPQVSVPSQAPASAPAPVSAPADGAATEATTSTAADAGRRPPRERATAPAGEPERAAAEPTDGGQTGSATGDERDRLRFDRPERTDRTDRTAVTARQDRS